ncbi:hypothetical protein [Sphingomonas sp.]|uniref:hypothetical protein n=1 Tax=Sphingomonas sp. TaxID=28214 RepID=UPI0035C7D084
MSDKSEQADMEKLAAQPEFLRFLGRVVAASGLHAATTTGTDGQRWVGEGRRDLALTILHDAARGVSTDNPAGPFSDLLIQVLREEGQTAISETVRSRRSRYDDGDRDDG